jgi:hypothetical protein
LLLFKSLFFIRVSLVFDPGLSFGCGRRPGQVFVANSVVELIDRGCRMDEKRRQKNLGQKMTDNHECHESHEYKESRRRDERPAAAFFVPDFLPSCQPSTPGLLAGCWCSGVASMNL